MTTILDAISSECSFSSHTQIYRVFKQQTGLSPRQWRDQTSGKEVEKAAINIASFFENILQNPWQFQIKTLTLQGKI